MAQKFNVNINSQNVNEAEDALELAKNGFIEVKQKETFGNIYVRSKQ